MLVSAGCADTPCVPCESWPDCITKRGCCGHMMPSGWIAEVPPTSSLGTPSLCDDCCDNIGGTYKLIPPSATDVWHPTYNDELVETGGSWQRTGTNDRGTLSGGGSYCQWVGFQYLETLTDNLRYKLLEKLCASDGSTVGVDCEDDDYYWGRFEGIGPSEVPLLTMRKECMFRPEFGESRQRIVSWVGIGHLRAGGIGEPLILFEYIIWAEYSTGWITKAAMGTLIDDAIADPDANPITLDLQTYTGADYSEPTSPSGCAFQETITVRPDTNANNRVYVGCENQCPPPFDDGPHGILLVDGTIGTAAVDICLVRSYDDTLGSLKWEGGAAVAATCGTKAATIRIYCGYLNLEDEERQWLIKFINGTDGTSNTFPLTIDEDGMASISEALSAFCGDTVTATIEPCTAATAEECCGVSTECCENVPKNLPVRLAGLFPGSGSITYNATGGPGGGPAWLGSVTGSNCTTTIGFACLGNGDSTFSWYLSLNGGTYRRLSDSVTCDPFSIVVALDPWFTPDDLGVSSSFELACSHLIIGDDDGSIEDVPSLDVTMTFTPSVGSPFVLTHTVTPDGCNSFSDTFTSSSPCGSKTITFSFDLSASNTIDLSVVVDGTTIFTGHNVYGCEPFSAAFGSAAATFCGVSGSVTAAIAETP